MPAHSSFGLRSYEAKLCTFINPYLIYSVVPPWKNLFFNKKTKIMNESATVQPATANPNKALWEKGDFTSIASAMRESGAKLIGQLGVTPGMDVLDLGCGDGTTALPSARLGAKVQGVDIARNLVAAGNKRIQ